MGRCKEEALRRESGMFVGESDRRETNAVMDGVRFAMSDWNMCDTKHCRRAKTIPIIVTILLQTYCILE